MKLEWTVEILRWCVLQVLFFTLQGMFDPNTLSVSLVKKYHHPVPEDLKVVSEYVGTTSLVHQNESHMHNTLEASVTRIMFRIIYTVSSQ